MKEICPKIVMAAGLLLVVLGLYGSFVPRLTADDGAMLIAGAVLLGAGVVAGR